MSTTHVPKAIRVRVAAQAGQRYGYCRTSETLTGLPLEVDHLIPEALGGETIEDNLYLHLFSGQLVARGAGQQLVHGGVGAFAREE